MFRRESFAPKSFSQKSWRFPSEVVAPTPRPRCGGYMVGVDFRQARPSDPRRARRRLEELLVLKP